MENRDNEVYFCWECKKIILDDEWVTNWGSCEDCLNKSLDEYYKKKGILENE